MTKESNLDDQLRAMTWRTAVSAEEILAKELHTIHDVARHAQRDRPIKVCRPGSHSPRPSLRASVGWAAAMVVLVAVIVTAVVVPRSGPSAHPAGVGSHLSASDAAADRLVKEIASISTAEQAGVGLPSEIENLPRAIRNRAPLKSQGHPELLYVWASYCPFCAAENWGLVMALSKFGTFNGLSITNSSLSDFAPDTRTLSFYGATYSSPYLAFKSYDLAKSKPAPADAKCNVNGYACLQELPSSDQLLLQSIGGGSLPFIDFGNTLYESGAGYSNQPLTLQGLTAPQVAFKITDGSTPVAQAVVGSETYFTAAICAMIGHQLPAVCGQALYQHAESAERG
ncbi:MAG: DUF929 family protein [Acidimicrobiales bacterium]